MTVKRGGWAVTLRQDYPLTDAPDRKRGNGDPYTPTRAIVWTGAEPGEPQDGRVVMFLYGSEGKHYAERLPVSDMGAKTRSWLQPYLDDAAAQVAAMVEVRKGAS